MPETFGVKAVMAICGVNIYGLRLGWQVHRPDRCEPPIQTTARHPPPPSPAAADGPNTSIPNMFHPLSPPAHSMVRITSTPFPPIGSRADRCEPIVTRPMATAYGTTAARLIDTDTLSSRQCSGGSWRSGSRRRTGGRRCSSRLSGPKSQRDRPKTR